jgi:tetratricopeptide (TPR) repeat protein
MIRFASFICAALLATPVLAKTSVGVTPSQTLAARAQSALAQNKTTDALDLYESAVAADPKNAAAYVGLGRAYEAAGLQGKALRYYRLALDINPNDINALEAQVAGMMAKGAPSKAQVPLDRLRKLCPKGCAALTRADAAFAKVAQKTSANNRVVPRAAIPVKKTVNR